MTMLEELVGSLLHEGYALYPYTPGSASAWGACSGRSLTPAP